MLSLHQLTFVNLFFYDRFYISISITIKIVFKMYEILLLRKSQKESANFI